MRKYLGYIPAVIFTVICGVVGIDSAEPFFFLWLASLWCGGFILHKGFFQGAVFGVFPAVCIIVTGAEKQVEYYKNIEIIVGVLLLAFFVLLGAWLWKKRNVIVKAENKEIAVTALKFALSAVALFASSIAAIIIGLTLNRFNDFLVGVAVFAVPTVLLMLIWLKKTKKLIIIYIAVIFAVAAALGVNYGIMKHEEKITVNTSPNIDVYEYLPFDENSKIVKKDSKTLKLTDNLPIIDGAAALFPVYSAFVNAVYPDTTKLYDGVFEYNNTPDGYALLAEKQTDVFIGVYPSDEQTEYAEANNTTFEYTPIGTEAFVFFVHKDNPVESLTTEQIKGIYSGEITNWKQVGGNDEEIAAFQRNEGSGSQSMLKRFMGDVPLAEAPTERVNDLMVGIIEKVSNYKSKSNSIGFSFRYYVEGIIKNPDIKMIGVDGVTPTAENIKNGTYPITTPIYAVTYAENTNENTHRLIDWILSAEGQSIIEESGYVGIRK